MHKVGAHAPQSFLTLETGYIGERSTIICYIGDRLLPPTLSATIPQQQPEGLLLFFIFNHSTKLKCLALLVIFNKCCRVYVTIC